MKAAPRLSHTFLCSFSSSWRNRNVFLLMREVFSITERRTSGSRWLPNAGRQSVSLCLLMLPDALACACITTPHNTHTHTHTQTCTYTQPHTYTHHVADGISCYTLLFSPTWLCNNQ